MEGAEIFDAAINEALHEFGYDHLPPRLAEVSMPFHAMAHDMARMLRHERPLSCLRGLWKLAEAKDCMVRCRV